MIDKLIVWIKKRTNLKFFLKSPINFIYSVILTLLYVDKWTYFPAILIHGKIKLKFIKKRKSYFEINGRLILEQWMNGNESVSIYLDKGSETVICNDFSIGNGVRIFVDKDARLKIGGKKKELGSGITAKSIIMVKKYLEIGSDCIIAWDTFLTDCDWHGIEGKYFQKQTILGDHVWIGVGVKVLKGSIIGKESIVTTNSVVHNRLFDERTLISGNPAIVIKTDVSNWSREMVS
ncbi:hypothetical protein Pedsa_3234 [Pseudopedobacter saltans DSM 12145]|uniref:Acyltransferase n=1 Tax=Pseudopedobacter saltans (strain ATCC 51119 / DSM 12145 / JCM 21818 / CCUG 39354 / LMG 10337 / NBRC 100064 / NCIMB 13643) TaxID=762903 RepID=F0SBE3_PSESL|nr:hypothetical protein [Pseudopedobacter saltans]ADY53770.1 hypothetical protein Pedsa_3234 [Pseudopedobacter saltans DSM 12145]